MVEGGGEERRVVFGWLPGGSLAVMPGCLRKRLCGVNGSPDVAVAGVAATGGKSRWYVLQGYGKVVHEVFMRFGAA